MRGGADHKPNRRRCGGPSRARRKLPPPRSHARGKRMGNGDGDGGGMGARDSRG